MTKHPFVSTPNDGPCSSCGRLRSDPVHVWKEETNRECRTCKFMGSDPDGTFCGHPDSMRQSAGYGLSIKTATELICAEDVRPLWVKDPLNRSEKFEKLILELKYS